MRYHKGPPHETENSSNGMMDRKERSLYKINLSPTSPIDQNLKLSDDKNGGNYTKALTAAVENVVSDYFR